MRSKIVSLSLALLVAGGIVVGVGGAGAQTLPPTPDPNFAIDVAPRPCALEGNDAYERKAYQQEGWKGPDYVRYPGACQRMRFNLGPIPVKPGQNDIVVEPLKIEKPVRDGYITRFEPNLVRADGTVPPVENVHLHHATWLSVPAYGSGPFFAAGEEKTIAPWPTGYGMPVKSTDQWLLLYMVHSAVTEPMEVYLTYDIDFVPENKGKELGIKPAYPVWLDVRPSGYPVFNVQRRYGGKDGRCTWPTEECAAFDPYEKKIVGQGQPGNGKGEDLELPPEGESFGAIKSFKGGTLIGIGGHLHPGGIQNEIDLVRPGWKPPAVRRKPAAKRRCKAPRRGSARQRRRAVRRCKQARKRQQARRRRASGAVSAESTRAAARRRATRKKKPARCKWPARRATPRKKTRRPKCKNPSWLAGPVKGDAVRIYTGKAAYWDHKDKSKTGGPPTSWDFSMRVNGLPFWGVHVNPGDKLRSNATYDTKLQATYENMGISVALLVPDKADGTPNAPGVDPFSSPRDRSDKCRSGGVRAKVPTLCPGGGIPTHGHYTENGNYGGAAGTWRAARGAPTDQVSIANFQYLPGDLSNSSMGVPAVKLGTKLRFNNAEGPAIYHSVTSCAFPCLGQTGAAFPLSDGKTSLGRELDIDSSELGIGAPEVSAAKQRLDWELPVTREEGFRPGEKVTYFCRIHPFMRGGFEVTE